MTAARRETRIYYFFLSFKYNFGSASGFSGSHFTGECEVGRVYMLCSICVNVPYIMYTRLTKPSKVKTVYNSAHTYNSDVPNIMYLHFTGCIYVCLRTTRIPTHRCYKTLPIVRSSCLTKF